MSITSDNAGNCDTMLVEIRKMLATKGIKFKIEDQRIRCLAHIINLACQASLKILKEANFDGSSGNTDDEYFEGEEDSTNI
ncbi:unnamed protein product, partial [Allacma fusca]